MSKLLITLFLLATQAVTWWSVWADPCPDNLVNKVQTCFSDLARAVHARSGPDTKLAETGAGMTLDYSQIKLYCANNGHMSRFVTCIETLVSSCESSPQSQLLDRLVSPQRVKQAVPSLCARQNEVEAASSCMNTAMTLESDCKVNSYTKIKADMSLAARNTTAMFFSQCTFFHSLAECQRRTVSDNCGANLGDLHADFLLSFVPTSCIDGLVGMTSRSTLSSNVTSQARHTTDAVNRTSGADDVNSNPSQKSGSETPEVNKEKTASLGGNGSSYQIHPTTTTANTQDGNSSNVLHFSWFCYIIFIVIKCLYLK